MIDRQADTDLCVYACTVVFHSTETNEVSLSKYSLLSFSDYLVYHEVDTS